MLWGMVPHMESGTVANWVSGIGTWVSASIALGIAIHNGNKDARVKKAATDKEKETEAAVVENCISMLNEMRIATSIAINRNSSLIRDYSDWKTCLKGIKGQCETLKKLPGMTVGGFFAVGRVEKIARQVDDFRDSVHPIENARLLNGVFMLCDTTISDFQDG